MTVAKDIAAEHEKFSDLKDSQVLRNVVENDAKKGRERKILAIKVEAAKAVLGFFDSAYGAAFLGRMLALGIDPKRGERAAAATEGPLAGAGCVLTGTLSRPRGEYAALIEAAGGIVQSAVTSKTKYLIAGANVGATKTEKARKLGTERRRRSISSPARTSAPRRRRRRGSSAPKSSTRRGFWSSSAPQGAAGRRRRRSRRSRPRPRRESCSEGDKHSQEFT